MKKKLHRKRMAIHESTYEVSTEIGTTQPKAMAAHLMPILSAVRLYFPDHALGQVQAVVILGTHLSAVSKEAHHV